ncbi:MAG TPA: T9SS type A sorting domain-containing protein [Candidatus Kapabacteria bacterium]|nr:T9SS type A sorting domain-containing protein [Candidatus Kapabacteria bacterium]
MTRLLCLLSLLCLSSLSFAQVSSDAAIGIDATVDGAAHTITLHWKSDPGTTTMSLFRRLAGSSTWAGSKKLANLDSVFIDSTFEIGKEYEYRISKSTKVGSTTVSASGYIRSGIATRVGDEQARCILLIDTTYLTPLRSELQRLESDLISEGHLVTRVHVARTDAVANIKSRLSALYSANPEAYSSLFIIGHVPVPYSGFLNPDGHPNHYGAWPADMYYGEFDGDWTDDVEGDSSVIYQSAPGVYDTVMVQNANLNFQGDGRFDQLQQPDAIDLRIGRVDLYNMPAFKKSDTALLRQYLDKDHAYRTGAMQAPEHALLDDAFGYFGGEAFASSGWRNFAPLVGRNNISQIVGTDSAKRLYWLDSLSHNKYLWAYGCGGGWDQGAGGVCSTQDFAAQDSSNAIFTMLFGSYFGDWNTKNNFLRSPLCTSYGLSCAWSGRPYWYFFPMGMGHTTGDAALLTQNNTGDYAGHLIGDANGAYMVHIALMGDPTLRMRPYAGPASLNVTDNVAVRQVGLSWDASKSLSYNVYRASVKANTFTLLTPQPIIGGSFIDNAPLTDSMIYLVRAVKSETTASGNYNNLSYGAWGISPGGYPVGAVASTDEPSNSLSVLYPTNGNIATIVLTANRSLNIAITIVDISGKEIAQINNGRLSEGTHRFDWKYEHLSDGLYFVRAISASGILTQKIVVRK